MGLNMVFLVVASLLWQLWVKSGASSVADGKEGALTGRKNGGDRSQMNQQDGEDVLAKAARLAKEVRLQGYKRPKAVNSEDTMPDNTSLLASSKEAAAAAIGQNVKKGDDLLDDEGVEDIIGPRFVKTEEAESSDDGATDKLDEQQVQDASAAVLRKRKQVERETLQQKQTLEQEQELEQAEEEEKQEVLAKEREAQDALRKKQQQEREQAEEEEKQEVLAKEREAQDALWKKQQQEREQAEEEEKQ